MINRWAHALAPLSLLFLIKGKMKNTHSAGQLCWTSARRRAFGFLPWQPNQQTNLWQRSGRTRLHSSLHNTSNLGVCFSLYPLSSFSTLTPHPTPMNTQILLLPSLWTSSLHKLQLFCLMASINSDGCTLVTQDNDICISCADHADTINLFYHQVFLVFFAARMVNQTDKKVYILVV